MCLTLYVDNSYCKSTSYFNDKLIKIHLDIYENSSVKIWRKTVISRCVWENVKISLSFSLFIHFSIIFSGIKQHDPTFNMRFIYNFIVLLNIILILYISNTFKELFLHYDSHMFRRYKMKKKTVDSLNEIKKN